MRTSTRIIRRQSLLSTFAILLLCQASSSAAPPNIVVFLCDDLGYGDLECYGHPHIKTPHLNQLASEGIRFTDCYSAAPVCSPSRVGLLTGRSPNRAGVYDWIPAARGDTKRPDARNLVHMRASEITIPQLLKKAGYVTCLSGKWHCNARFNSPDQPQPDAAGFDHWFATQNNASPSHANPKNYVRNGNAVGPLEGYSCQLVVDEAIRWLDGQSDKQPFFLYLAFHEPHEPVASPSDLVAKYEKVARNKEEAEYFANVENIDRAVGRMLTDLKRRRLDQNTLVFFTSDNGPETLKRYKGAGRSYGQPGPLRGMKLWTTEAGFRVAGILRWPAGMQDVEPGLVSSEVVSSLDFLPTFCELAGTQPPSDRTLDGTSFLPLLNGKKIERETPLLWCYYNAMNEHRVAMRHGKWKMLARLNDGRLPKQSNVFAGNAEKMRSAKLTDFELYLMPVDIGEATNVTAEHPQALAQLSERMQKRYRELIDNSLVWE